MELLAPTNNLAKAKIAFQFGADAIYLGVSAFSLRAHASLDNYQNLKEIITYTHNVGKKVYLTVNIIPTDKEIKNFKKNIKKLISLTPDAFIVSSFTFITFLKKAIGKRAIEIHLSTQQSVLNSYAIAYFKSLGVQRIVLGRELTINEINVLNNHGLAFEVFVHGGVCMSYSGRCELSLLMNERSANLGDCAHSCRWQYLLYSNKKLVSNNNFSLASKDLSTINIVDKITKAYNVCSLKIEGRMKSENYIASITNLYHQALEKNINTALFKDNMSGGRLTFNGNLDSIFDDNSQIYDHRPTAPNQEYLMMVTDIIGGRVFAITKNAFNDTQECYLFAPNYLSAPFTLTDLRNIEGELISKANHPQAIVSFYPSDKSVIFTIGAIIKKWPR